MARNITIKIPKKLLFFMDRGPTFKIAYGGRGGGKSHSLAQMLLLIGLQEPVRVLCVREIEKSIAQSTHQLLSDYIDKHDLHYHYKITHNSIRSKKPFIIRYTNKLGKQKIEKYTEFIFKGVYSNISAIRSYAHIDIVWAEEAADISAYSWEVLLPTVLRPTLTQSIQEEITVNNKPYEKRRIEVWSSFNPQNPTDTIYQKFIINPPENSKAVKINYDENEFLSRETIQEAEYCKKYDIEKYNHVWLGEPSYRSDKQVFKDKWEVRDFITPGKHEISSARFFYGIDWGFAVDPTVIIRCFIKDSYLFIDNEIYGREIETADLAKFIDPMPEIRSGKIYGDNARPETISALQKKGFNIEACKKYSGSVHEGIVYMKSFKKIIIHPTCRNTIEEFSKYSYKIDKASGEILPEIVDAYNHCIDATRYALSEYIKGTVDWRVIAGQSKSNVIHE